MLSFPDSASVSKQDFIIVAMESTAAIPHSFSLQRRCFSHLQSIKVNQTTNYIAKLSKK